jgi:hypothetical protein
MSMCTRLAVRDRKIAACPAELPPPKVGRWRSNMTITGANYEPTFQQIAFADKETGESGIPKESAWRA